MRHISAFALLLLITLGLQTSPASVPDGPLTMGHLVNHPERWPAQVKISRDMKFGRDLLKAGTAVAIHSVSPKGVEVRAPQGFLFDVAVDECDLIPAANAQWAALTPAQREVTLAAIAQDPSLMPAKVATSGVLEFARRKYPAGTEFTLLNISGDDIGLWAPTNKGELFSPADTDIFPRARQLAALPIDQRPGRLAQVLKGHTVDAAGKPVDLPDAKYFVAYVAASTCPRCHVFTPKFLEHFQKNLADRKDVAFFTEPTDATTGPMLAYVRQNAIPWPTLPTEKKAALYAMMEMNGMAIPGICVMDRFGNVLLSTKRLPGDEMAAADAALAKLDEVLKPAATQ